MHRSLSQPRNFGPHDFAKPLRNNVYVAAAEALHT